MIFGGQLPDFASMMQFNLFLQASFGLAAVIIGLVGLRFSNAGFARILFYSFLIAGSAYFLFTGSMLARIRIERMKLPRVKHYETEMTIKLGESPRDAFNRRKGTITYDYPNGFWGLIEEEKRKTSREDFDLRKNPIDSNYQWFPSGEYTRDINLKVIFNDKEHEFTKLDLVSYVANPERVPTVLKLPTKKNFKTTRIEHLYMLFLSYSAALKEKENEALINKIMNDFRELDFHFEIQSFSRERDSFPLYGSSSDGSWLVDIKKRKRRIEVAIKEKFVPKTPEDEIRRTLDEQNQIKGQSSNLMEKCLEDFMESLPDGCNRLKEKTLKSVFQATFNPSQTKSGTTNHCTRIHKCIAQSRKKGSCLPYDQGCFIAVDHWSEGSAKQEWWRLSETRHTGLQELRKLTNLSSYSSDLEDSDLP